jgi:hypothetical protein
VIYWKFWNNDVGNYDSGSDLDISESEECLFSDKLRKCAKWRPLEDLGDRQWGKVDESYCRSKIQFSEISDLVVSQHYIEGFQVTFWWFHNWHYSNRNPLVCCKIQRHTQRKTKTTIPYSQLERCWQWQTLGIFFCYKNAYGNMPNANNSLSKKNFFSTSQYASQDR